MEYGDGWRRQPKTDGDLFAVALSALIERIRAACDEESEWPERVGAGLYAAIEYLSEEEQMARALLADPSSSRFGEPFREWVGAMAQLLDEVVPVEAKPGPQTPAAALAGAGLLVGDCVRFGRLNRLPALCQELHLMILLPFLGFDESKIWAQSARRVHGPKLVKSQDIA